MPNDFALALTFTGGGLGVDPNSLAANGGQVYNYAMAMDSAGNVWVTGAGATTAGTASYDNSLLAAFSNLGTPLTPATTVSGSSVSYGGFGPGLNYHGGLGLFHGPEILVIDQSQNLWIEDEANSSDTALEISTSTLPLANSSVLQANFPDITADQPFLFDATGNIWVISDGGSYLAEIDASGNVLNFFSPIPFNMQYPVFDSANNLWVQNRSNQNNVPALINTSTGNSVTSYTNGTGFGTLAAGSGGNIYACNNLGSGGRGTGYLVFNQSNLTAPTSTFSTSDGRCDALLTVDGAGNLWSLDSPGSGNYVLDEVNPGSQTQLSPNSGLTGTSSAEPTTILGGPVAQAIDGSGNLWVLNNGTGSTFTSGNVLVEFVGIAAPTVQPLSISTQNGSAGTRP